jgi:hypothetical protein
VLWAVEERRGAQAGKRRGVVNSGWDWGGKTGLGLGSIPCRILGKHHTPKMGGGGGDLSL